MRWDIMPGTVGNQREGSKEDSKHLRQMKKNQTKEEESRREYYLISVLSGSITNIANSWLVDSEASRHDRIL